MKPYESGGTGDSEALWRAAGAWQRKADVCLYRFTRPMAPGLASPRGRVGDPRRVLPVLRRYAAHPWVVEGAGGLFVPLTPRHDVIDLIGDVGLPAVVVARAGLGTINHTTLTLQALAARGLDVAGVVLVQAVRGEDVSIPANRPELERRFPHLRFLGPAPFIGRVEHRRVALRALVAPLVTAQFGASPRGAASRSRRR